MTDYFALFNEPRRPWLDPEALKKRFLEMSAQSHPDRVHKASDQERAVAHKRYLELNTAYNCLREARERLGHFLELELGTKPKDIERIPEQLLDYFQEINQRCREADALLAEKRGVNSPLLQVQMFHRSQECTDQLRSSLRRIDTELTTLLNEVQQIDSAWEKTKEQPGLKPAALSRLERIYRLLSYFNRWNGQLQERIVQLAL